MEYSYYFLTSIECSVCDPISKCASHRLIALRFTGHLFRLYHRISNQKGVVWYHLQKNTQLYEASHYVISAAYLSLGLYFYSRSVKNDS